MFPAFLTTILFSISGITGFRLTKYFGGTEANLWRLSIALFLLAIWSHAFGIGFTGSALPVFFISGVVGFGFGDIALMQSFRRIGSRLTILIVNCLSVPIAASIEWVWMGTSLTGLEITSAAIIITGVALALVPSEHIQATKREWTIGILCGAIAAFGQGFGAVLSRKGFEVATAAGYEIDGIDVAYQRLVGGVLVTGIILIFLKLSQSAGQDVNKGNSQASAVKEKATLGQKTTVLLVNSLAGPALGVACMQWALQVSPTGIVLSIIATTPLVIIPLSRYYEGEMPTVRSVVGGVVAVAGVILLSLN